MTLFDSWAASMRRRRLSAGTITKRRYELASWSAWMGEGWAGATWRDVEAWIESRPLGPRAQASAVSHLRSFYKWARREGLCNCDPCLDVMAPKLHLGRPRPAKIGAVLAAVGPGVEDLEVACALMAYGGLRCCEVARLAWEDVNLADGVMWVRGKGDKEATVPISPPLAAILAAHDGIGGPVVPNAWGRETTPARISQRVNIHLRARRCGCTAHQLRHYAGTHLLQCTGRIELVRDFLRHASISTTQVYAETAAGALAKAVAAW